MVCDIPMAMVRRFLLWVLVGAMLALTPLAQASPPDQTWMGGLFDDDDYDNVVVSVTASVASMTLWPSHDGQRLQPAKSFVGPLDESDLSTAPRSSSQTRAPPRRSSPQRLTAHGIRPT
jgi:hypothetical protein